MRVPLKNVEIDKYALGYIALHIITFIASYMMQDTYGDENMLDMFEARVEKIKEMPFSETLHWVIILKSFTICCYDIMVILYILKPESKLTKTERDQIIASE